MANGTAFSGISANVTKKEILVPFVPVWKVLEFLLNVKDDVNGFTYKFRITYSTLPSLSFGQKDLF